MNETDDELKESIAIIAKGFKRIRKIGLNQRAIILLLQDACPANPMGRKPNKKTIQSILESLETLEQKYLKG